VNGKRARVHELTNDDNQRRPIITASKAFASVVQLTGTEPSGSKDALPSGNISSLAYVLETLLDDS